MGKKNDPNPMYVRILFELPEYLHELLLSGRFPKYRSFIVIKLNNIISWCKNNIVNYPKVCNMLCFNLISLLCWINDNWKKKQYGG